jgi:peptidoglycan/LPS O-acetylase OafA/YrhL
VVFFLSEGVAVTIACIALTVLMRWLWERPIQRWGSRVIARAARKGGDN